jgi:restriction system protein
VRGDWRLDARGSGNGFAFLRGHAKSVFATLGRSLPLSEGQTLTWNTSGSDLASFSANRGTGNSWAPAPACAQLTSTPAGPLFSKPRVKRLVRRGANAGGEFWGCAGYPACKGMSAIGQDMARLLWPPILAKA